MRLIGRNVEGGAGPRTYAVTLPLLMTGLLSVVIFSSLFIVVVIDRPFSGAVTVKPDALAKVLAEFGTR